ncbi:MAG: hypothetical protein MUC60_01580 [Oscillatoria sp. Prado101]|nr:hypothetical protein [Oscillatoria sp. Prado101]
MKIWDAATGKVLATLKGHSDTTRSSVFSPDGKWIAVASADNTVKIWDATNGKPLATRERAQRSCQKCSFQPRRTTGCFRQ